ncbi:hypothetical protein [Glutamicibacter sp. NPDC090743]|uniref:hypothetical protein n=1 Tax=Glutamicibacter sp. NPDC090743 TaxID=3364001 RepID=UPI0037F6C64C
MNHFDPDSFNTNVTEPLPGDDLPALVNRYQALKCAAIVKAFAQGQTGWQQHVHTVSSFLSAAAMEAAYGVGVIQPTREETWQLLDALPWPRPGGAQRQQ